MLKSRCVFLQGGQVLQIPQVRKEHAGKYTCQAVNEAGEDRMHFQLEVLGRCQPPHATQAQSGAKETIVIVEESLVSSSAV